MEYRQITYEERVKIQALFNAKHTYLEIGRIIGKHHTTVAREVSRNSINGTYDAKTAHRLYCARKSENVKRSFEKPQTRMIVRLLLCLCWSPEQIAGRLKLFGIKLSHETIYKWIYAQQRLGINLLQYLRINKKRNKRGSRYTKRAQIRGKKSIHERPEVVKDKNRLGDWEGDTVEGKKNSGYIATFVDRKSLLLTAAKMENKRAETFNKATAIAFSAFEDIHTLTFDNGSEMSRFAEIEEFLNCNVYFADPGNPGQRGANENTNGLLRQFFPKGADLSKVTQAQVDKKVYMLNNRPRKTLGFKSPMETYLGLEPTGLISALRL